MIHGITFADEKMSISAERCKLSMLKNGADSAEYLRPNDLSSEFIEFNKDIFIQGARGAGCYWLFKPYIIYKKMLQLNDGDLLIYSDAGIEFVNSVRYIIEKMDEDIFFFTNGFPQVEWCKGDVLKYVLDWDVSLHDGDAAASIQRQRLSMMREHKQVQGSVIFFKVNETTRNFVKEWLLYCQMPGFIDDSPSKLPNYPTFAEHRHDQAVLTCLQIKYGYKLHFWPTDYSEHIRHTAQPGDNYPTIFFHHRKRNADWRT